MWRGCLTDSGETLWPLAGRAWVGAGRASGIWSVLRWLTRAPTGSVPLDMLSVQQFAVQQAADADDRASR